MMTRNAEELASLKSFAAAVLARCDAAPAAYRFGRYKTFIAALDLGRAAQRLLVEAHQHGFLVLSRCDLTPAVEDRSLIAASEIAHMNATFHFISRP